MITKLEAAILATENAYSAEARTAQWAVRCSVETTKWARQIEAELGNADEIESLQVRFDEKTLSFVSALLNYNYCSRQVYSCYEPLFDLMVKAIKLIDATDFNSAHHKLALQSLVVRAAATRLVARTQCGNNLIDDLCDRSMSYKVLVTAFRALSATLQKRSATQPYPTEVSVKLSKLKVCYPPTADCRNMFVAPFVDCLSSTHPANIRLLTVHTEVTECLKTTRLIVEKFRVEHNREINEKQHATGIIEILHSNRPDRIGIIKEQVKEQNQRRLKHAASFSQTRIQLDALRVKHKELVVALFEATAETQLFLEEIEGQNIVTVDRKEAIRTAMNNCLAVDSELRRLGRELAELEPTDLSLGQAAASLSAEYEGLARTFRLEKSSAK
ncbi:MAG TPA: hypothetical protein V6C89_00605 [Drouetiella sp.]